MISCEAAMLVSRLAVLLSAFYHRFIIAHELSSFHCDAGFEYLSLNLFIMNTAPLIKLT